MQVHVTLVTQEAAPELGHVLEAAAIACGTHWCRPCLGQSLLASSSTAQGRKQLLTHLHAGTLACAGSGRACAPISLPCPCTTAVLSSSRLQACCCLTLAAAQLRSRASLPLCWRGAMKTHRLALRAQHALEPPCGPQHASRQQMLALHAPRSLLLSVHEVMPADLPLYHEAPIPCVLQASPALVQAMTLVLPYQWDLAGAECAVNKVSSHGTTGQACAEAVCQGSWHAGA